VSAHSSDISAARPLRSLSPTYPQWATNAVWIASAVFIASPWVEPLPWVRPNVYWLEVAVTLSTFALALLSWSRLRSHRRAETAIIAAIFTPSALARLVEFLGLGVPFQIPPTSATRVFSGLMLLIGSLAIAERDLRRRELALRKALWLSTAIWTALLVAALALSATGHLSVQVTVYAAECIFFLCSAALLLGVSQRLCRIQPGALADALRLIVIPFAAAAALRLLPLAVAAEQKRLLIFDLTLLGHAVLFVGLLLEAFGDHRERTLSAEELAEARRQLEFSSETISELSERLTASDEEALRFSSRARMLEAAVETMPLGVTVSDLAGSIVYVNSADALLHGYSPEDLVGRPTSIFQDSTSPRLEPPGDGHDELSASSWTRETWNVDRVGNRFPVRLISSRVRSADGSAVGLVTVCEDLRKEQRLAHALASRVRILTASSAFAERLLEPDRPQEAVPEALAHLVEATDADFAHLECGGALARLRHAHVRGLGSLSAAPDFSPLLAPSADLAGSSAHSGSIALLPAGVAAELARRDLISFARVSVVIEGGSECVLLLASRERGRLWNEGEIDAAEIAVRSFASSARRAQAQARLDAEERRFRQIVDEASDLILGLAPDGRLEYVNPAWTRATGLSREASAGRSLLDFVEPEARAVAEMQLQRLRGRTPPGRIELLLRGADGSAIEVEGALSVQPGSDGLPALLGILRDVTERRRLERLQQEFLSTVSHELRTPLTSLLGSLMLLRNEQVAAHREQWLEMLDIADRNGERLLRLINDLLDLRKVEVRGLRVRIARFSVDELLRSAEEGIRGFAESYGIRVVTLDESGGEFLSSDKERLVQVLFNLLSNAIKFSPPNGSVELSAKIDTRNVVLLVTDHGPGLPHGIRERLFQPFVEPDSKVDRTGSGAGLGLAIAKGIVTALQGEIRVESSTGGGTRVSVLLPRASSSDEGGVDL